MSVTGIYGGRTVLVKVEIKLKEFYVKESNPSLLSPFLNKKTTILQVYFITRVQDCGNYYLPLKC